MTTGSGQRRPRVYLVGAAGFPNYGDELIAARWLDHLAEVAPEADVWLDCPHPGTSALLLDGRHPRARFVDTFWQLCWLAPVGSPLDVASWVQSAVYDPGLGARWGTGIQLAAGADVLHVLGGGFINDLWPRHVGVLAAARAAARRSGGRAVITGAGLSPAAPATRRLLAALLADFAVVDVRDATSLALLDDGVGTATGDDALLGVGPRHPEAAHAPGHMLCLQSDLQSDDDARELAAWAIATLRTWRVDPCDVGVVEGIPGHDRVVFSLIEHELPSARFYPFIEVWERGLPAAAHQTWLSTRFHVHLEASRAGARGLAVQIGADYYYGTKHASLAERGSGWESVTCGEALPARPAGVADAARLARAVAAKRAVADAVYPPRREAAPAPSDGPLEPAEDEPRPAGPRSRWWGRGGQ